MPVSQSRPLLRLQRPLIEPYVTFSVIRLSGSLPPAAFSTSAQCVPPRCRGRPFAYFADVLTRLVNLWPASRLDELMPWVWAVNQCAHKRHGSDARLTGNFG